MDGHSVYWCFKVVDLYVFNYYVLCNSIIRPYNYVYTYMCLYRLQELTLHGTVTCNYKLPTNVGYNYAVINMSYYLDGPRN